MFALVFARIYMHNIFKTIWREHFNELYSSGIKNPKLYTLYLQRHIDSRQKHLSLVFVSKIFMTFSLHSRVDLNLKSHF